MTRFQRSYLPIADSPDWEFKEMSIVERYSAQLLVRLYEKVWAVLAGRLWDGTLSI